MIFKQTCSFITAKSNVKNHRFGDCVQGRKSVFSFDVLVVVEKLENVEKFFSAPSPRSFQLQHLTARAQPHFRLAGLTV